MEKYFQDQENLLKQTNDGRVQIRQLNLFKSLQSTLEQLDKKNLTQIQSRIETTLLNLIMSNRITSDILSRYICYIYIFIFDKGRNSHLTDFISNFCEILNSNKEISENIKCSFLFIIGYICKRCEYKSPAMANLLEILINLNLTKNCSSLFINESMRLISKFLNMKISNCKVIDFYKLLNKKEKEFTNKKYVIKALLGSLNYYDNKELIETNFFHKKYSFIMDLLENYFKIKDEKINSLSIKTFTFLHDKIIFQEETLQEILSMSKDSPKKEKNFIFKGTELLNFLHVIQYFSQIDSMKNNSYLNDGGRRMISHLNIIIYYIEKNKELINLNEIIIDEIYEILINCYNLQLSLTSLSISDGLNIVSNTNNLTKKENNVIDEEINKKTENDINNKIIFLYRTYIKTINITSYRMHFLTELFSKLKEVQTYIDKLTEDNNVSINDLLVLIENKIIKKVYTIPQINVLLLSLVEISDHNPELFELNYNSFNDISNSISFFLTSGIRSFRILVTKFVCSLSYYLPRYRLSIIALILNLVGVLHLEVVQFKNTMLYFNNLKGQEYKDSIIIHKSLLLFKDICNCLSMILCTVKHKSKGLPLDSVKDSFKRAKNIILGNQIDFSKNPISLSKNLTEEGEQYLYKQLKAYKEGGWVIIQGLISMSKSYILKETESFFYLLKYTFNENCCELTEEKLNKAEYKDNLINEFLIKKASLTCLNKYILLIRNKNDFLEKIKDDIKYLLKYIIAFFIPYEKKEFCNFYKIHLKEAYIDTKKIIYEIVYNLPIEFYIDKFNELLYPLSDEIASGGYLFLDLYKHFIDLLNNVDNFMCIEDINIDTNKCQNQFFIDNYYIPLMLVINNNEKELLYQNIFYNKSYNFIYSSMCLLIKIITHEKINAKNKAAIIKFFLDCFTEVVVKGINFKAITNRTKEFEENIGNYNKLINIVICLYLILKNSAEKKINFITDLETFTNIKMVFDLCHKIEDFGMLSIISCEGISYLISLYDQKNETLVHYLSLCEITFNVEKNSPKINDYICSFYLLSKIFKNVDYSYIQNSIDKYMNFIISCFNPNDDVISNPYVGQALFSLCMTLINLKEYDKIKALVQIYEMNLIYTNNSNKNFIRKRFLYESINELKLMIIFMENSEQLDENENEKKLFSCIMDKFIKDKLYKNTILIRHFLILINIVIKKGIFDEYKKYFLDKDLVEYLFITKTKYSDNSLCLPIINYYYDNLKINSIENKICAFIKKTNELYHYNKNYFYNNKIYKIYFNNNENNISMMDLIDYNNIYDKMFSNYHLIMNYKHLIKKYILSKYKNIENIVIFFKNLFQQKKNLYLNPNSDVKKNEKDEGGNISLKGDQDNSNNSKIKSLIEINNLNIILHINLQKFMIKQITESLLKYVSEIISINNVNNKNIIDKSRVDVLNKLMNISMILLQCEESWEIKYLGIKLLEKLIVHFHSVKDIRGDDDSLLIQQYEVQISSCIKNIFNSKSTPNVKSLSKGFNLIYLFMTVSISNEIEYIKKFNEYIHFIDIINGEKIINYLNYSNNSFEKEEKILNIKYFLLISKLYISVFTKKNFTINIQNKGRNKIVNIYSSNMGEDIKDYLKNIFKKGINNFCSKLKSIMLSFKDGNNKFDNFSLKYIPVFMTLISILIYNNDFKNIDNIFETKFNKFLCEYVFYFINQNIKNKNIDNTFYILDIFSSIIKNKLFKLNNEVLLMCIKEFINITDNEKYNENKNIISLIQNFNEILLNNISDEDENYIGIIKSQSDLIKKIRDNYSKIFDPIFINIYSNLLLKLIKIIEKEKNEELNDEYNYYLKLIFENYENNTNNDVTKLTLEKIFSLMLNIKEKKLFEMLCSYLNSTLIKIASNIQKYFTLFYLIIQFISKSTNNDFIIYIKKCYINEIIKNKSIVDSANKSMLLSVTQMSNNNLLEFLNEYLTEIFNLKNEKIINSFGIELQKLIIIYIQKETNDNSRQSIIKNICLFLNENNDLLTTKEISNLIINLVKINEKDNKLLDYNFIESFNEELKKNILDIIKAKPANNETGDDKKEENKEEKKEDADNGGDEDEDFDEVEG